MCLSKFFGLFHRQPSHHQHTHRHADHSVKVDHRQSSDMLSQPWQHWAAPGSYHQNEDLERLQKLGRATKNLFKR